MREQILAVQRMQDYIEKKYTQEITLTDLARVSFFSPWYSYRLFKQYLNMTPAEYIRKVRLSNSARILKKEKCKILDVAFEIGFGSVDGYQRAFYREFGCNPGEYAVHPVPVRLFIPYGVKFKYLRKERLNMENIQSVFIQVIHKPARKVIIKRGVKASEYFAYCSEVGCDVWGILTSMDSLCGEPVCLWLPEEYRKPNTSEYVQGVEVPLEYNESIPEGFDIIELPETNYLMFQGEPFLEENFEESILGVQHSIEKYDPSAIGYMRDNSNPKIQLEPRGERGYIEMVAIAPL